MAIVTFLCEYGIKVICLGGEVLEPPSMLLGTDTIDNVRKYNANKMFFSTGGVSSDGVISSGNIYHYLHNTMQKNSKEVFYLADHQKIDVDCKRIFFDLSKVDYIISDYVFSNKVKEKYKNTNFVEVETPKTQKY